MRTYYIYKATNKVNGKLYIGQTVNYHARVQQHLRCSPKEDCLFHRAIKEYGKDNFEWEVIDKCNSSQKALRLERFYISLYNTYRDGYNENKGGVGLITTGLIPVSHKVDPSVTELGNLTYFPRIDRSRSNLAGWRDLAYACHSNGAALFIQLTAGLGLEKTTYQNNEEGFE